MITKENKKIETEKTHRRKGGAFDTMARVFRNVTEFFFNGGLVMRNRPSEIIESKNVFEMYVDKDPGTGKNLLFFGRSGDGTKQETKNINYIELIANADTSKTSRDPANGQVAFRMSEDKVTDNNNIIGLIYGGATTENATGVRAYIGGSGDGSSNDLGGVQLVYYKNGVVDKAITLDRDGMQFIGLPTSASGLSTGSVWNDSGTLKIVT